jgi:hypothetical protein
MYKYLLILFTGLIYSQKNTLTIVSKLDKSFIENVLIYTEKDLIGKTDENGFFEINSNFKILKFVKENFNDVEYNKIDLDRMNWRVELVPIKMYELETVNIVRVKEHASSILEKIKQARFKQNHRPFKYYQSNVLFKCNQTILFSFNNIIYPSVGLKVNDKSNIIYNGFRTKHGENIFFETFELENKSCVLPVSSSVYCSLTEFEISQIFEEKIYDYELSKTDDLYILKFFPKKKNSLLLYDGYYLVDKFDFGIVEMTMNLASSNNNIWKTTSHDLKTKYEYNILEDNFKFKFSKHLDGYKLDSSSRNMICKQIKGNHIGAAFEVNFYNEETLNHDGLKFRDYDFMNNKFK